MQHPKFIIYLAFKNQIHSIFIIMKLLEGKTAIITGASRGIGKSIVEVFAAHGANVAFTYSSSAESALALEAQILETGVKAKAYKSDAADFDQAQTLVEQVLAEFGSVDILINNAGVFKPTPFLEHSETDFEYFINIILRGTFFAS